jgi:hypothetical protein
MARKPNNIKTAPPITLSTTPPVVAYLEQLVATGLYGKNPAEAAERLVANGIRNLLKDGTLLQFKKKHLNK